MPLILLACALGAGGAIMELWRPGLAVWFNIAGIALLLAGVVRWLAGGKRSARNGKDGGDSIGIDGAGFDGGSCDAGGCDGGGGGGD